MTAPGEGQAPPAGPSATVARAATPRARADNSQVPVLSLRAYLGAPTPPERDSLNPPGPGAPGAVSQPSY
jgi:hypothetical protein